MKAESLQDAITLLPEELLIPVDRLRQKKRFPWKSLIAAAACFCLLVGLQFVLPDNRVAMDSANGGIELGEPAKENQHSASSESSSPAKFLTATVLNISEDRILCTLSDVDVFADKLQVTVSFENWKQIPALNPDDAIRIYYDPEHYDAANGIIKPYRIEIIKEETK